MNMAFVVTDYYRSGSDIHRSVCRDGVHIPRVGGLVTHAGGGWPYTNRSLLPRGRTMCFVFDGHFNRAWGIVRRKYRTRRRP